MLGNMMQDQLLISGVLEHALKTHPHTEIVSHTIEGEFIGTLLKILQREQKN